MGRSKDMARVEETQKVSQPSVSIMELEAVPAFPRLSHVMITAYSLIISVCICGGLAVRGPRAGDARDML